MYSAPYVQRLELGFGTGRHGRLLAAKGFRVHGIERSADMGHWQIPLWRQRRQSAASDAACAT
jgi:hypothetical protein